MLKIEQIFAPNLRSGAIVVMDILLCYKVADTWEAIEYQQIPLLYLPLYNPTATPLGMPSPKPRAFLR